YINAMLENGANGYLLKNATKQEMLQAIQTTSKNKQYLSKEVADNLKEKHQNQVLLTRREKEILKLIAEGLTSAEIGKRLFISTTTVDTHRKHLLEKLKAGNTAILIKTAVQLDLIH
ncbi:MAG TPA: response regulator transcription factor, partial [Chitinophagales bacterium]|nr:response regulator transcription factor [Chitinophagales bacterium]